MEAETVLVVPPPSPRPFPLCGICVSRPEAATLKVLTLGYAILISLECFLPPFLTLGSRSANSILGTDSV